MSASVNNPIFNLKKSVKRPQGLILSHYIASLRWGQRVSVECGYAQKMYIEFPYGKMSHFTIKLWFCEWHKLINVHTVRLLLLFSDVTV